VKTCIKCQSGGPFYVDRSRPDGLRPYCKACDNARQADRRANVPGYADAQRATSYRYALRTRYGMTEAEYDAMLAAQGGGCAICSATPTDGKRMPVDHDHETGVVRGILCDPCNVGLGRFRDNPELLTAAVAYLHRSRLHEVS
jgi:hypothetical protein